jgi:Flp pilus assembly pilin Flp
MFYKVIWFYTKHERGASMVEYALLVMMIAMVALAAVAIAGSELSETYSEISSGLTEAGN